MYLTRCSVLSTLLLITITKGWEQSPQSFVRHSIDPNEDTIESLPAQPKFTRNSADNTVLTDDRNRPPPLVDFIGTKKDPVKPPTHKLIEFQVSHHPSPGPGPNPGPVPKGKILLDFKYDGRGRPTARPPIDCEDSQNVKQPDPPEIDQNTHERIVHQNRHLIIQAHKNAIYGYTPKDTIEPKNSLKMLRLTSQVFKKFCPTTVIPITFTDHVIILFTQLHSHTTPTREAYLTDEEVTWIEKLMGNCEANKTDLAEDFTIDPKCRDRIEGDGRGKRICTDPLEKFNDQNYDPLLDLVWRIFETVHTACFPHFQGYPRVWHRYVMGIYDLFTLPVKQRWRATVSADKLYFLRLLGPTYPLYSDNIDMCTQYWGNKFPLPLRLPRLHEPYLIRYGANIVNIFDKSA